MLSALFKPEGQVDSSGQFHEVVVFLICLFYHLQSAEDSSGQFHEVKLFFMICLFYHYTEGRGQFWTVSSSFPNQTPIYVALKKLPGMRTVQGNGCTVRGTNTNLVCTLSKRQLKHCNIIHLDILI